MRYVEEFCDATIKLGHETVHCMRRPHPDPEQGPHEDDCFGAWPPCPKCGGIDLHTQSCSDPISLTNAGWAKVTWVDGGKPKVSCGRRRRVV